MHGTPFTRPAALLLGLVLTANIQAQTTSADIAREIQRQNERNRQLREQQENVPDVRLETLGQAVAERIPDDETPCFPIREIQLRNDASFPWAHAALDSEADPATGRCLGSKGINIIMARLQNAMVERGYITTRVLAEPQDLRGGVLVLTIIPGRIRAIRFSDDSPARANAWNAIPAKPGDILNLRDIEQGLENFKRVPTAEADIQIVPAEAPGESDLLITWKQAFPLRLTLAANDGGSRSTGKHQGSVTLSGDHLLTLNDLFYASLNNDLDRSGRRGTHGGTLHYSLPYGNWLLGATASKNNYHQTVAGLSQDYRYSGTSKTAEIRLTRLLHRNASHKTSAYLRSYLTQSANFIDDTEVEVQRRRMAGWESGLQHRAFIGQATLDLSLAWRQGTGAYNAIAAPEEVFGEGTARPRLLTAESGLDLPFKIASQTLRYTGTWRAQWNRTPLVPQDRFSIGGRYTVRGFDGESVLMAERGWLIRNDLGINLGDSGQSLYLGLDHGQVGGQSADLLIGKRLTGAVIGLRGGYKGFSYDVFTGRPLKKPDGFETARNTSGINLTLAF